jgi:hypothetical protein
MKLIFISPYRNRGVSYDPGQILDLTEAQAQAILADSPGSFAPHVEIAAVDAPPVDKMIRSPSRKKDS